MIALPPVYGCINKRVLTPWYNYWHGVVGDGLTVRIALRQDVKPLLNSAFFLLIIRVKWTIPSFVLREHLIESNPDWGARYSFSFVNEFSQKLKFTLSIYTYTYFTNNTFVRNNLIILLLHLDNWELNYIKTTILKWI